MSLANQNDPFEAIRRGKTPSSAEEAGVEVYLSSHPEERPSWEEELALNHVLRSLPSLPLSSNFTSRVLAEATRQTSTSPRTRFFAGRAWNRWVPQLGTIAAAVCVGWVSFHQHQLNTRRELARNLVQISRLASSTPVELLQNFDAIERLNQVPRNVERELIAALQ